MFEGLRILAVVPARGGSKGLEGKNIRSVAGRPLLAWTLDAARDAKYLDRVIVTSEDDAILEVARGMAADVPFIRPMHLAQDDTPGVEPVLHALRELPGYQLVVLLQPTSPLRSSGDIDASIALLVKCAALSCVTVVEASNHPYWTYRLGASDRLVPFVEMGAEAISRRQDLPRAFALNGAVYVARVDWLCSSKTFIGPDTVCHEMPAARSLDVDTLADIEIAERALLARRASVQS